MKNFLLLAIVFISGASVLAIEILGTRLLGPFYGVSIFLWSALITVTLVALALGYWIGGRWADRRAGSAGLAYLLAAAGAWILLIPWMRTPLLNLVEPLGLRSAVLAAAFILFAPPLSLLGMVTPLVIRLKTATVNEVGRAAGDVFAISTMASVLSALAVGFWLIPLVGVGRLTRLVGILLVGASALAWLLEPRRDAKRVRQGAAVGLLFLAGLFLAGIRDGPRDSAIVALRDSAYGELRVLDRNERRFLLIDGGIHTIVDPQSAETYFAYVPVIDVAKCFSESPGKMCLVGLGGGSVARSFHRDGWSVDAVEIDPEVVTMAREHFDLEDAARVFVMDGRRFFREHDDRYDLIVLDAFGSSSIPFHLVSREAIALMANRLSPDGLLVMNVESVGWNDPLVAALFKTMGTSFENVAALPTAEPPNALGNVILMAAHRPLEFDENRLGRPFNFLADDFQHWSCVQRNHAWNNRYAPVTKSAPIFTDDLNPVDVMAERINLAARRSLHANAALAGSAW
jgi:spermidine synthase